MLVLEVKKLNLNKKLVDIKNICLFVGERKNEHSKESTQKGNMANSRECHTERSEESNYLSGL